MATRLGAGREVGGEPDPGEAGNGQPGDGGGWEPGRKLETVDQQAQAMVITTRARKHRKTATLTGQTATKQILFLGSEKGARTAGPLIETLKKSGGKTMATQVRVNTTEYLFSHSRQPRGYGHWAFEIGDRTLWLSAYYRDAKKEAVQEARKAGIDTVKVLP